jgi:hypothetical protein
VAIGSRGYLGSALARCDDILFSAGADERLQERDSDARTGGRPGRPRAAWLGIGAVQLDAADADTRPPAWTASVVAQPACCDSDKPDLVKEPPGGS